MSIRFLSGTTFSCHISSALVHPCDKKTKGGCDQICEKNGEAAKCACKEPEFKLAEDTKSCEKGYKIHSFYKGRLGSEECPIAFNHAIQRGNHIITPLYDFILYTYSTNQDTRQH